jgi:ligand-binding sensor domain-containing protein
MVPKLFEKSRRAYKAAIYLLSMLLLFGGSLATAEGVPEGNVVSLSHDPSSGDLFVAYPRTLYRLNSKTYNRVSITMPTDVERLTAVVATAEGAGNLYIAAPGIGVLLTRNQGASWQVRNTGLPSKDVTALIRHAQQPDTLYAVISGTGIYRSENGGDEWQLMDGGPDNMADVIVHSDMPDSMQTGWIFAGTKVGVSRSMDCFCLWRETGPLTGAVTALTYDPSQPSHIYAATAQGVSLSRNGGASWATMATPKADVTALLVTASGTLYAGTHSGELFLIIDKTKQWESLDVF